MNGMGGASSAGTAATMMFTDPKVTNPPFAYPRYMPRDNKIQRGYMRLLGQVLKANLGTVPDTPQGNAATRSLEALGAKLDFQFNPNQLNRSVTARTDTQLWINQSPSELLTPGLGDMSFQWTMIFNREEEVQRYYNQRGRWNKSGFHAESANSVSLDALIKEDPEEPRVAERIGILADIMVMDQITGQRLTEAAIEFSKKWSLVRPKDGAEIPEDEPLTKERQDNLLKANLTNAAFLIPNPIRVVFSENFMVDGYVNTVAVSIQKFSPDMVPTVCSVDISMHALYQGFARQSTVFTTLAEQIVDDDELGGSAAWGDEDANEEATDVSDASFTLQEKGMLGTPILAGFDHSPSQTLGDRGRTKMDDYRAASGNIRTVHQCAVGERDLHAPKGGYSLNIQLMGDNETAIEYGIVSNMKDSDIGKFLAREKGSAEDAQEYFDGIKSRFSVVGYIGVALRARLKADSSNSDPLASLQQLWEDGNDNGFTTYNKGLQTYTNGTWDLQSQTDDHFFDRWSQAQRKRLFAVGIDTYRLGLSGTLNASMADDKFKETNTQTSGFYTRSFPIIELAEFPGYYGDMFRMDDFNYGSEQINADIGDDLDEGWIWCGDYNNGNTVLGKEWAFPLANGFYDASNDKPFPEFLYLKDKNTNAVVHTFQIEYQQALTLRVRMNMTKPASADSTGTLPISDTGVLWIYARSEANGIIKDVDGKGIIPDGVHGAVDGQGYQRGVDGEDIQDNMHDYRWIEAHDGAAQGLDDDMFYDGLYNHSGKNNDNMKIYGVYSRTNPSDVSLGGLRISSVDILANNKNIDLDGSP